MPPVFYNDLEKGGNIMEVYAEFDQEFLIHFKTYAWKEEKWPLVQKEVMPIGCFYKSLKSSKLFSRSSG